jgi:hypothetical protein
VKTKKENSAISRQGNSGKQWGCEETPLRLQHTISRKAATQENQEHPGADWNLQGSRWQLFIGSILMLTWTRRFI